MSEIPEDILRAAEETLDNMLCECTESCGGTEGLRKDAISKIGAAILAERKRCMRKINGVTNGCTEESVLVAALAIQHAIAGEA